MSSAAFNYLPNSYMANPKVPSEGIKIKFLTSWYIKTAYFMYLCIRKLATVMLFPAWYGFRMDVRSVLISGCLASFFSHVFQIVGLSTEKQVHEVYTGTVIAVMADAHSFWYGTYCLFPNETMRSNCLSIPWEFPVAIPEFTCLPFQTRGSIV